MDAELNEFPLRMRDWLKNVLVSLYERDEENNLLTEKQTLRVSPIINFYKHSTETIYCLPTEDGSKSLINTA